MKIRLFSLIMLLCLCTKSSAQLNQRYLQYIQTYKDIAIEQMHQFHIPASITLAQGILESGAGYGDLAQRSNNHFGIKCGSDWKGPRVYHDDDARGEAFRKYNTVRESYEDHSRFLRYRSRYSDLFKLDETDYKGWAHGLKKAGYATNPQYAYRLIALIEDYQLHQYDNASYYVADVNEVYQLNDNTVNDQSEDNKYEFQPVIHQIKYCNGIMYVEARKGDTLENISDEFRIRLNKLQAYNELFDGYVLSEGERIYLNKKKNYASKHTSKDPFYIVKGGDSMHGISQLFGIRLKKLYRLNRMQLDDNLPPVGYPVRIR